MHAIVLLGVLAMNHLLASPSHDAMGMATSVAAPQVFRSTPSTDAHIAVATDPTSPVSPGMGGCEGAMILCGAMIALVVVTAAVKQRSSGSVVRARPAVVAVICDAVAIPHLPTFAPARQRLLRC